MELVAQALKASDPAARRGELRRELRRKARAARAALPFEERRHAEQAIARHLAAHLRGTGSLSPRTRIAGFLGIRDGCAVQRLPAARHRPASWSHDVLARDRHQTPRRLRDPGTRQPRTDRRTLAAGRLAALGRLRRRREPPRVGRRLLRPRARLPRLARPLARPATHRRGALLPKDGRPADAAHRYPARCGGDRKRLFSLSGATR